MRAHIIAPIAVAAAIGCGSTPSTEQIEKAQMRVRVLANCLDDVAEGIGTGTFNPQYTSCVEDILGAERGGMRELLDGGLGTPVRDLLSEHEKAFQDQIDQAVAAEQAGDDDTRRSRLLTYQMLLKVAAEDLRGLAE